MENKIIDGIVKFYFIAVSVLMYYFLTEVIDISHTAMLLPCFLQVWGLYAFW